MTDSFSGFAPGSAVAFIVAQLVAAGVAYGLPNRLFGAHFVERARA
jgi:hypothetical protein